MAIALLLAPAAAAAPPQLWQACPTGSGAGQCRAPMGVAADPRNGHVFVADANSVRINEFTAAGEFVKTWGWDVIESGPDDAGAGFEICVPDNGDVCKGGLAGSGAGQLSEIPVGVAVDSAGNVYVTDRGFLANPNLRVQKFSPSGQFQLMFGGEVNKTKSEEPGSTEAQRNLCTAASGDVCGAGTLGTGKGQFGEWAVGDFIAIDDKGTTTATDDKVYVGDQNRIQVFDTEGHYAESLPLPGKIVQALATDSAGDLYAAYSGQDDVHKLSPTGSALSPTFALPQPNAVAVGSADTVFAFHTVSKIQGIDPLFEFSPAGKLLDSFGGGEFDASIGLATNLCPGSQPPGNLYVTNQSETDSFLRAYGTPPNGCFKARTGEATEVQETAATLNGTVNPGGSLTSECHFQYGTTTAYGSSAPCTETPAQIGSGAVPVPVHAPVASLTKATIYHYRLVDTIGGTIEKGADQTFKTLGPPVISAERAASVAYTEATLKALVNPEGFSTTYHFQYTTEAEFEAHGFEGAQSTNEVPAGSDRKEHTALANLSGLDPGISYRWRLIATNSSGETLGEPHTFTTYRQFATETDCPNQTLRGGASAFLPDCRAYEMVSPVDKSGGDIEYALDNGAEPIGPVQAKPDGNAIAYVAAQASFAANPVGANIDQYLASRGVDGWSSQGLNPPVSGESAPFNRQFIAFSSDLCGAWLVSGQALTADAQQGLSNLYRRQDCGAGAGGFEALTSSPPVLSPSGNDGYVSSDSVQGLAADASRAFFAAKAPLTPEAAEGGNSQLYERFEGANHLVSVLPNGAPDPGGATGQGAVVGSGVNLSNAVSRDGTRVYWTSAVESPPHGTIYLRRHPEQGIVAGECSGPGSPCTLPVSASSQASYWTAAEDGSRALYSEGEDLFEFDLAKAEAEEPARRLIAHHVRGVTAASEDLSRIYFISNDAIDGEAEGEAPGQPNLYLAEGATFRFIATVLPGDVDQKEPGAEFRAYELAGEPYGKAVRLTPDGSRLAFESRAPLTGFDNTDPATGKPAVEVYIYTVGSELSCVSCNPSGARPAARELPIPYSPPSRAFPGATRVVAAAWIPTWGNPHHTSNVLSADGSRLFFNSNDALLPRDTNGTQDVYEWEEPGAGRCSESSPSFFAQNGGCLFLISSGESPDEAEFWEASTDGSNVFFNTASGLLPQDPGSIDLYDARVEGGFHQPTRVAACEGEACQSPPEAPNDPTPASSAFQGAGNVVEATAKACRKPKVRRHGRCVSSRRGAKQKHGLRRSASANRGVAR